MLDFELTSSFDEVLQNVKETLRNYFIMNHIKNMDQVWTVTSVMIDNLKILVSSNEPTQTTLEQLEKVLKKHYNQKKVLITERYNFFKRDQIEDESITSYVDELKKLATTCLFGVFLEEALRDRLVCGIKDETVQADLLSKEELTFDYAYQYASTMERLAVESKLLKAEVDPNKNKKKLKNKKKKVDLDVDTTEELHHAIDIKEELEPFKLEILEEIDDLKGEPIDNLLVEPVNPLLPSDKGEEQFKENTSLQNHLISHRGTKQHTCKVCGRIFARNDTLVRHLKVHKDLKPFLCETCNDCFSNKESWQLHMKGHVTVGKILHACQECGKEFATRSKLRRHLKTHAEKPEKPKFECEFCNRSFTRNSNLKQHLKNHAGIANSVKGKEELLGRPISNKSLEEEISLVAQNDERNLSAVLFKCYVCEFTSEKKHNLRRHVNVHSGHKRYLCDICDYRTTSNRYLQNHILRHTGIRPFACEVCEYKSATKSNFTHHMETVHSGEKKYVCEFCAYKTNNSAVLRIHLRTHTGEKPFECKICNYKTSDRSTLRNHVRIHTGEKPYSCKLCDYRAAQRTGLVYHLKTHQKKNVTQIENSLL